MKKQLLEGLKAKFPGVSDTILSRIAEKLSKTANNEEDAATAIEGVTFNQILESYGDSRATEATQSAVGNYEKKHGLKEGQKAQGDEPQKKEPIKVMDETPEWARAIIESNKQLSNKLASLEGDKVTLQRKGQLSKLIEKLPEGLQKPYNRMAIDSLSDEEFSTLTEEITAEVDSISSTLTAKGSVFTPPVGGKSVSTSKPSNEELEAIVGAMKL